MQHEIVVVDKERLGDINFLLVLDTMITVIAAFIIPVFVLSPRDKWLPNGP